MDSIHPELRKPLKRMPSMDPRKRLFRAVGRVGPKLMRTPKLDGVSIESVQDSDFRARIYRPAVPHGAGLLWVHGGGLVIGALKQDDQLCASTAARTGITVVSVEYRLAPEHSFPAALDDIATGWHWLLDRAADWGLDTDRLGIGGESAGGGLAAALVQRLHDSGGAQPVAQWLFAPMLDDRTATRQDLDPQAHPVWNNAFNHYGWGAYLGQPPGSAEVPAYAVPARREDLTGLPPAWLYAGDIELFHDEINDYAQRLRAAGVDTELEIVPGGAHGFENWAHETELAQSLMRTAQTWIAERLRAEPT